MKVYKSPGSEIYTPRTGDAGFDLTFNSDLFTRTSVIEVTSPFAEVCLNGNKLQFSTLAEPSYFRVMLNTGIAVEIPKGNYGKLLDRSSMAKRGFYVSGGVIDSIYTGFIHVILNINMRADDYIEIHHGDKIAQMVVMPYVAQDIFIVESLEDLAVTERGNNGFGSTGR